MADRWSRVIDFEAGATRSRPADVGPADPASTQPPMLGTLRVGFGASSPVWAGWTITISPPAQGIEIGPLDLPCLVSVELPARVLIQPPATGAPSATSVALSAVPGAASAIVDGAVHAVTALAAATIEIPAWATAVSALETGVTFDWLSPALVVLSTSTGLRVPRTRRAQYVRPSANSVLVFHFNL